MDVSELSDKVNRLRKMPRKLKKAMRKSKDKRKITPSEMKLVTRYLHKCYW